MDYNEALYVLGLQKGFTLSELNKKYKLLIRKWHPDICDDPRAIQMSQRINLARDILLNNNHDSKSYSYDNRDIGLINLINDYLNKINILFKDVDLVGIDGSSSNAVIFRIFLESMEAEMYFKKCRNNHDAENTYLKFMENYCNLVKKYISYYCIENGLSCDFIDPFNCILQNKYTINYKQSIFNVYSNLEDIKSKIGIFKRTFYKVKKSFN